jgi:hypothetical protein
MASSTCCRPVNWLLAVVRVDRLVQELIKLSRLDPHEGFFLGDDPLVDEVASHLEGRPEAYHDLIDTMKKMESHYRDMQDMEFTVENGKLYLLQTRNGTSSISARERGVRIPATTSSP